MRERKTMQRLAALPLLLFCQPALAHRKEEAIDFSLPHAHGSCLGWKPILLWLHVGSDLLIAIAYFSIPLALLIFVRRRRDLQFSWMFVLFGVFILACGTTHFLAVWTLWRPDYLASGVVKAITAVASVITAAVLWPLIPKAVALPGPAQWKEVHDELRRENAERRGAEEEVRRLNAELELEVEERSRKLLEVQEELARKEKLSILGQLSGSVGHELRNPLGVMGNAVYFLKMVLADADETVKEYLGMIEHEIGNSQRIIADLLDFARTRTPQRRAVSAAELIKNSLGTCAVPGEVTVAVDVPQALPDLSVDPQQIGQVLQNFITNAVQAMPEGGSLSIGAREARNFKFQVSTLEKARAPTAEGDWVAISVADTGEGIAPEHMGKLFQPLFSTKPKGVGLGLVVCKNIVDANGGWIEVESEQGKGTTFTVWLPVHAG